MQYAHKFLEGYVVLIRFFLKVGQCSQVPFKIHGAQKWDSAYKFSEGYTVHSAHKFLRCNRSQVS